MDSSKRQFLQQLDVLTAGASLVPLAQAQFPYSPGHREDSQQHRYATLADLRRCISRQVCTVSCATENQVPQGGFRIFVDQHQVQIEDQQSVTDVLLSRLCNHCDNPPCVSVCPVQAIFQREGGIVVVDNTRYVGYAYCAQACPYDVQFINHEMQTADRRTFCVHRLEAGLFLACVESYIGDARIIGDIKDSHSHISQMLYEHHDAIKVPRPESGTSPSIFYLGLGEMFVTPLTGRAQPALWQEV